MQLENVFAHFSPLLQSLQFPTDCFSYTCFLPEKECLLMKTKQKFHQQVKKSAHKAAGVFK